MGHKARKRDLCNLTILVDFEGIPDNLGKGVQLRARLHIGDAAFATSAEVTVLTICTEVHHQTVFFG